MHRAKAVHAVASHRPVAAVDVSSHALLAHLHVLFLVLAGSLPCAQIARADPEVCSGTTCTFSGSQVDGIPTSRTITSVTTLRVNNLTTNLGAVTLDRGTLQSLSTVDIDTGTYMGSSISVTTDLSKFASATNDSPNGRSGRALTLNFAGSLTWSGSASAVTLSEGGKQGYDFVCQAFGNQCDKSGGAGGSGAKITVNASGSISSTGSASAVVLSSSGASGGDAGNAYLLLANGAKGGRGGAGGALTLAAENVTVSSVGTAVNFNSQGGNGGEGSKGVKGGEGGIGGTGGLLTVDTTVGSLSMIGGQGLSLSTRGGAGGIGGNNVETKGDPGGTGGAGGGIAFTIDNLLLVSTTANDSPGLYLLSQGGGGGKGGINASTASASDGGVGGKGGDINLLFADDDSLTGQVSAKPALQIETFGDHSAGLEGYTVGGGGGNAGSTGGNGDGGAGGLAGNIVLTAPNSAVDIATAGNYSRGISLSGQGADGGTGSDGAFWVSKPGSGGDASSGGFVYVVIGQPDDESAAGSVPKSTISTQGTDSAALYAESIGGGKGGDSGSDRGNGVMVTAGSGGDAGILDITIGPNVTLRTYGTDSPGIAILSAGGSGGSGGNSDFFWGAAGGKGGVGGNGGSVSAYNGGVIETAGIASAGIRAQSIGGSGGNGGTVGSGSQSWGYAIGGNGGGGGSGGDVNVISKGTIITRTGDLDPDYKNLPCGKEGCAYGILAQSIGGSGGTAGSAAATFVGLGGSGSQIKSDGGLVAVLQSGSISTEQDYSDGIFAQSLGGGGGVAGMTAAEGVLFSVGIGGSGGLGGDGNQVDVTLIDSQSTITTSGSGSAGIRANSTGGGGGNAASTAANSVSYLVGFSAAVGGSGGTGGHGGSVNVKAQVNKDTAQDKVDVAVTTTGEEWAPGIEATSIGGGGGTSLVTEAGNFTIGLQGASASFAVSVGGSGGSGGKGGDVLVDFTAASIAVQTSGSNSQGISAQSIGGGGGTAGQTISVAASSSDGVTVAVPVTLGGKGGGGAESGDVTVNIADGIVTTEGDQSHAIYASSLSGGGGNASSVYAVGVQLGESTWGGSIAVGGSGGGTDGSGAVSVTNLAATLTTAGLSSDGIHAESLSDGGGNASTITSFDAAAGANATSLTSAFSLGGAGGGAGTAGNVIVTNGGNITVSGAESIGIFAKSSSGGGGSASAIYNTTIGINSQGVSLALGKSGGDGGTSGDVTVTNSGVISTGTDTVDAATGYDENHNLRQYEYGIYAFSLSGGGGEGSSIFNYQAGLDTTDNPEVEAAIALGGDGGNGGSSGTVSVTNQAGSSIETRGRYSDGIHAQSLSGGGGIGGSVQSTQFNSAVSANTRLFSLDLAIGGSGGGSDQVGGAVHVENEGSIKTHGAYSHGISAQSIGGGGGTAGSTSEYTLQLNIAGTVCSLGSTTPCPSTDAPWQANVQIGGTGGSGNDGGSVVVDDSGTIETFGSNSAGIFACSVGGGGGSGGATGGLPDWDTTFSLLGYDLAITDVISVASLVGGTFKSYFDVGWSLNWLVGGSGGASGNGGDVRVSETGATITTHGNESHGVVAISIGGGGGDGGLSQGGILTLATLGGDGGSTGNGGTVGVALENTGIMTLGENAHGIYAQSIGGGGGSAGSAPTSDALALADPWIESLFGVSDGTFDDLGLGVGFYSAGDPSTGGNGGEVTVTLDAGSTIVTEEFRSYGIFAQSVGGGGGVAGVAGLGLLQEIFVNPTTQQYQDQAEASTTTVDLGDIPFQPLDSVASYTGSTYGWGSGGRVEIDAAGSISTSGQEAHGIFAQSAGGMTGESDHNDYGLSVGGEVVITANNVTVTGSGASAIYAQSTGGNGNGNISVTVHGAITGTADAPVVRVVEGRNNNVIVNDGGSISCNGEPCIAILTEHQTQPVSIGKVVAGEDSEAEFVADNELSFVPWAPDLVSVYNSGTIEGDIVLAEFSTQSLSGNLVVNETSGTIIGTVDLGPTCFDSEAEANCSFINHGTWYTSRAGADSAYSRVGFNSLHNDGTIVIRTPTTIDGSLTQETTGNLVFVLDELPADPFALTVSGSATIAGTITPQASATLSATAYKLVTAPQMNVTATIDEQDLLYGWTLDDSTGGMLTLKAVPQFTDASLGLSQNQENVAAALQSSFLGGGANLGAFFASLRGVNGGEEFRQLLSDLSPTGLLQADRAVREVMPGLLTDALDCPVSGGADVLLGEASCLWLGAGRSWGHYSGDSDASGDLDGDLYALGGQKEFRPGWFLAASVGRLDSEIREDRFSSSGETNVFSLGLKRRSGRWEFGASAAYGSGSFDNRRLLRLPGQAEEAINSDADVDVLALRARSSYEFGLSDWAYLRPSVALDVVRSEVGRIREGRDASFALDVEGPERSDVALTTGVQIGAFTRSGNNVLRGYVDAGWRYAPDAGGELHGRLLSTDGSDISARLDPADSTGVLKVGAQWLSARRLDLRLEYGLEDSGGYRRQSATARLGWVF